MKMGILASSIILVSLVIAVVIIQRNYPKLSIEHPQKKILNATTTRYVDPIYKFSFSYPDAYHIETKADKIVLWNSNTKNQLFISSVATTSAVASLRQRVLTLCHTLVKENCLVDSQSVFTNKNGVTGNTYYFKIASKDAFLKDTLYGPIYSFLLPLTKDNNGILFFYPMDLNSRDKVLLKEILETLTLPVLTPFQQTNSSSQSSKVNSVSSASSFTK